MAKNDAPRGWLRGNWTKQALRVLEERYLAKDISGRIIETPEGMCFRVAQKVASAEKIFRTDPQKIDQLTRSFYELMASRLFLPNSPTLMNAGREDSLQYSACFVLPVGDSLVEIFDAVKKAALIHQSGGGTGFSFSLLRPKGSLVHSSRGVASGPVSFMRAFDAATAAIKQGGMRRGANMGILRVDHPDILEFIECKAKGGITNFNISVAATDKFMKAVQKDGDFWFYDPFRQRRTKKLKAKEIFGKIVQQAWQTGDPGLIFIDQVNKGPANPVPSMGPIEATNPCGEQPLYSNEACNLGSINLSLVKKAGQKDLDWEKLKKTVELATRFLDDVIEVSPFPMPEITTNVRLNRRIGLGVMGWADLLFELEIPYDSPPAVKLARQIMKFMQKNAHLSSQKLALERGPFTNFKKSLYKNGPALRNATLTTIAPTGSISIIADCSSGIEPLFALAFKHKTDHRELIFANPHFLAAAKKYHLPATIIKEVEEKGTLGKTAAPEKLKKIFVTAHEISWVDHINIQAAFQRGTDNAVSKTINLSHQSTIDEVAKAYLYAYQKGCLGITVYRDGCRDEQVLYAGQEAKPAFKLEIKPRPAVAEGKTYRVITPVGTAFVTVNVNGNSAPLEVFVNVGKVGSDIAADAEAIGRLISLNLRLGSGFPAPEVLSQIVGQLGGIGGAESIGFGKNKVRSLADGVAKVLHQYLGGERVANGQFSQQSVLPFGHRRDICPACGQANLIFEENCARCLSCDYHKC